MPFFQQGSKPLPIARNDVPGTTDYLDNFIVIYREAKGTAVTVRTPLPFQSNFTPSQRHAKTRAEFQTEIGEGKKAESFGRKSCKNASCHFSTKLKLPPVIKITLLPNINPSLSTPIAPVSPFVFCARGVRARNTPSGVHPLPNFKASQRFRLPSEAHVINDAFMSLLRSLMSPDTICPRVIIMKVTGTSSCRTQKHIF
ncbi:hypothetical protein NPIL_521721 [Nephila pilipes]|uniref:Uncharacterized protein n=1 Tax=Nephila pilipes TaxID=299642 RepID=A0A8X6I2B6_NEPPI|nr:hypothetical protein NPIL_521721 [Nephila pilipes]